MHAMHALRAWLALSRRLPPVTKHVRYLHSYIPPPAGHHHHHAVGNANESTINSTNAALFTALGLDSKKATEASINKELSARLIQIVHDAGIGSNGCKREIGVLLYTLATRIPRHAQPRHRSILSQWIMSRKIQSVPQLNAALDFISRIGDNEIDESALENHCGVGVVVAKDLITMVVRDSLHSPTIASMMRQRKSQGLSPPLGAVLDHVRTNPSLRWADGSTVRSIVEHELNESFASLPVEIEVPPTNSPHPKPAFPHHLLPPPSEHITFPSPQENKQATPQLLEAHLKATGGKIVTRFPPEPNGYLHIGHAKAMHLDFGYASKNSGICYLRFDDTNPETEKQEYIDSIIENIEWLGYKVEQVTYSSKLFQELYPLAEELIKRGKAYVCHQTPSEIAESRNMRPVQPSPHRDRPIAESLAMFQEMKEGLWKEGSATLRMKMDLSSPNPCMWDLVAYRIKKVAHPITVTAVYIYPSYDFTHCLCDSLQNVTHSLCTLEFLPRREYITHTILSKRKLIQLVGGKHVTGWDDCRMPTINGLRRRGYPPEAIRKFCELIGVSRNQNLIRLELLEHCCREALDFTAPRRFVVLQPLKVIITNYPDEKTEWVSAPDFPHVKDSKVRQLPFSKTLYIEKDDFREHDHPDFYGLSVGKWVGLKYGYAVRCDSMEARDNGETVLHFASTTRYDPVKENCQKQKGHIHWVSQINKQSPATATVNLFQSLFLAEDPMESGDKWLETLNPNSMTTLKGCYMEYNMKDITGTTTFQFERLGFFVIDNAGALPSSTAFNLTVGLRESKKKQELKK